MMWFIFVRVLYMSIAMSAAGIAVLTISKIFGGVLTKSKIYYLWLLPIAAALIPLSIHMPDVKFAAPPEVYTGSFSQTHQSENTAEVKDETQTAANKKIAVESEISQKEPFAPMRKIDYKSILAAVYFIGVLACFAKYAIYAVRFRRKIRKHVSEFSLPFEYQCRERISFFGRADIVCIDADCSPFVFGIFHPRVAVPNGKIEKEALIHELVHIKRKDLVYLMIADIAKAIHFFNPLSYVFARQIRQMMELSCDECASAVMNDSERISYSHSIISCCNSTPMGSACLSESGENIKERITQIMEPKTYTKLKKFASALIVITMIITQTAFAAAVGSKTPVKSYVINTTSKVYSVVYINGDDGWYSGKSGLGTNSATLVNSPLFKGFSADLKLEFADDYAKAKSEEAGKNFNATMHIEMDKFVKAIDDGKHWQGMFTVTLNDEIIMQNAVGYLNYVPGNYSRDVSRLLIADDDKSIDVEYIDFDTKSDDRINAQYEREKAESFQPKQTYLLGGNVQMSWKNGKTIGGADDWLYLAIGENREQGRLYCKEIPFIGNYYIVSDSSEKFTFKGNSAHGKFWLKWSGNIYADEFYATLSGIGTDTLKLKSDDKTITVTMKVHERSEDDEYFLTGIRKGLANGREDGSGFATGCIEYFENTSLSKIPFTLTLNDDKTAVIMEIKDGFNPLGWFYSYSSYTNSERDVYASGSSDKNSSKAELALCDVDFASHNLQFNYYSANPYVRMCHTDIMFKIIDGEIKYSACNNYITENEDYSGAEGEKMIEKYFLAP